jgi:hypothetical protein
MSIGHFSDKSAVPNETMLCAALGARLNDWQRIAQFMLENYQLPGEMTYGGKNYGWNLSYRHASRPLLSLYPQINAIIAQIVLGKEEVAKAMQLPLGPHLSRMLRETQAFHDGLWLFVPLENSQDVEDALQLVLVKVNPARIRRKKMA